MGVSWMELMSDDLPYQVVEDYKLVMAEEARAIRESRDEMERLKRR